MKLFQYKEWKSNGIHSQKQPVSGIFSVKNQPAFLMKIFKDQYIVITGGAGFIGSCLVRHFNDLGINNLVIFDDLKSDLRWKNLVGKSFIDLFHHNDLFTWLKGREREIEAFVHLGADSDTMCQDANHLLENNTRFSILLAEYALEHEIRLIYASSAATYGDGLKGFSDAEENIEQYEPLNMYGYSKHLFDLWLQRQSLFNQVTGLKYFNVYGPNEYHKGRMASAIIKMTQDALEKKKIFLFESSQPDLYQNGDQVRDFIYVKDAVAMTADFLNNDLTGIYNVGTGTKYTWNQLARSVIAALGKDVSIEYIPMPESLQGKYQNYTKAEMEKTAQKGGMLAMHTLEEAVKDYVCNYLLEKKYW